MEQYKIDFVNKTLIVSAAFERKMNDLGSNEYKLYVKLRQDIPDISVVRCTHKSPTKYHTASGEVLRCNPYKHLTYESMERFISGLRQRDELMAVYNFIKNHAALPQTSRYIAVRRWFAAQFPDFRKNLLAYYNSDIEVITDTKPFIEQANDGKKTA